ncbi:hypothetical protein K440DRAFT_600870 [Wilcoxina mikolae CBS 423.85]|nr:hypothetical protein K440DRAFT_600870 [Wilcoxina mikolae CBS 423.85]
MHEHNPLTRSSTATTRSTTDMGGVKPRLSLPTKIGRDRSPGLQWHREYTPETMKRPRCLMIDYVRKEAGARTRKVIAEEIQDMYTLKKVYAGKRDPSTELRLFHIQNWPEATHFMIHKFRLHEDDDLTGQSGFADWIAQKKPARRAGKPLLLARTWKVSSDPWRRVTKCAVGLDIMKRYKCSDTPTNEMGLETRVTGLMGYDDADNPILHSNVYAQRTSMYVQYSHPDLATPGPDVVSPYMRRHDHRPLDELYDNGNTIIIFDNSNSHSINDTLIPARGEWESRWRRLPFYLHNIKNSGDEDEEEMRGDCMRTITQDVFKAVAECWDELLEASWEHVSILEDKIFEHPADESRAPELWRNSAKWLKYEKLMYGHQDAVNDLRKYLVELDGDLSDEGQWLKEAPADFKRLENLIEEDLVKRTNNLSELMYKSVGIRDTRESLRLGASMWRLSWITFIFLPLTFLCSFLGMNVDTFSNNPSIKWYFISAAPFMVIVLIFWYLLKHWFAKSRQMPLQRGAYEALFIELQTMRPEIWTRQGPREYVHPADRISRIKWALMTRWTSGDAIPRASGISAEDEPIGSWNRVKRFLIERWTREIVLAPEEDVEATGGLVSSAIAEMVGPSVGTALPKGMAGGEVSDVEDVSERGAPARNSGVLVEERTDADVMWDPNRLGIREVDWADRMGRLRQREDERREKEVSKEEEGSREEKLEDKKDI